MQYNKVFYDQYTTVPHNGPTKVCHGMVKVVRQQATSIVNQEIVLQSFQLLPRPFFLGFVNSNTRRFSEHFLHSPGWLLVDNHVCYTPHTPADQVRNRATLSTYFWQRNYLLNWLNEILSSSWSSPISEWLLKPSSSLSIIIIAIKYESIVKHNWMSVIGYQ